MIRNALFYISVLLIFILSTLVMLNGYDILNYRYESINGYVGQFLVVVVFAMLLIAIYDLRARVAIEEVAKEKPSSERSGQASEQNSHTKTKDEKKPAQQKTQAEVFVNNPPSNVKRERADSESQNRAKHIAVKRKRRKIQL